MPTGPFLLWTTIGSLAWNSLLITGGYALGARGAQIRDEIEQWIVGFVPDRADDRGPAPRHRAQQRLVGEREQVFDAAPAARDDDDLDIGVGIEVGEVSIHLGDVLAHTLRRRLDDVADGTVVFQDSLPVRQLDRCRGGERTGHLHLEGAAGTDKTRCLPQLLDDVETAQAIVMCAHNVFADVWVTSAADELGETVVGLLVAEVGGVSMRIDDTSRPVIAAAQELRALESVVRGDAFELLVQAVPDMEAVAAQFRDAPAGAPRAATPAQLDVLADALPEPGVRRLLVDLERRRGQQLGDTDTELWAMQKYEGG